jgi:hypothetical protein
MSFSLVPLNESQEVREDVQTAQNTLAPVARTAANLTGLAVGLPGDIASLLNDWVAGPISEAITGNEPVPYEETPIGKLLPTSQQHIENLRSIAPELLTPKNEVEKWIDDVVSDTALLASTGGVGLAAKGVRTAKGATKTGKAIESFVTSLGSNLAGSAIKDISGDESKGAYTKAGSMFLLSLLNKKKAAQIAAESYKNAESQIPANATANAHRLEGTLNNLESRMLQGTGAPSEKFILEEVRLIKDKIKNGLIGIKEAWASKRSLNEKLNDILYKSPDQASRARARKLAGQIQQELSSVLKGYGKSNPGFGKNFQAAEEVFGAVQGSKFFTNFVRNQIKHVSPTDSALMHALGTGVGSATGAAVGGLAGAGTGLGAGALTAYPAAKIGYRIFKSPVLRKHYLNVVKAAAQEDAVLFKREYNKLKEGIQKDEKKDTFSLMD